MHRFVFAVLCVFFSLTYVTNAGAAVQKPRAMATVIGLDGKPRGQVNFRVTRQGVLIEVFLKGLPPGVHALAIHSSGKCDAKTKFSSAGAHFSSDPKKRHGYMTKGGSHAGDLPNQVAASDGSLRASIITRQFSIGTGKKSIFDADGASFVVHVRGDDYISQPAGNSGDRLACGVIRRIAGTSIARRTGPKTAHTALNITKQK